MRSLRFLTVLLGVALGVASPALASGGSSPISVVASGLDSPRHLAFGDRGDLFVTEAGRGGPTTPCFVGGEGPACWGATGAVTKVDRWGRQSRIVDGLPLDVQHARSRQRRSARTASSCSVRTP